MQHLWGSHKHAAPYLQSDEHWDLIDNTWLYRPNTALQMGKMLKKDRNYAANWERYSLINFLLGQRSMGGAYLRFNSTLRL